MAEESDLDITFLSATELARAIMDGKVSAVEALEAYLERVRRYNPRLTAIATVDEYGSRRAAQAADAALARGEVLGPLHGVPVTVKDSFETAGLLTTAGHPPLARYVPRKDATVVARLRSAGAIILGKTNMPALGGSYQTNNRTFGRTSNPWDLSRTSGGSTGGGAAAVAAGLSALDVGSDIGGSIRIPAHFCGVFGLKPTQYRVSGAGHIPPLPGTVATVRHQLSFGPLARSVADLRAALSVLAGPDERDPSASSRPLGARDGRPLRERRFAWTDSFGGVPVTAETRSALERLASDLAAEGCRVERCSPAGFDFSLAWKTCHEIAAAERHAAGPFLARAIMIWGTMVMPRKTPMMKGFAKGLRGSVGSYLRALAVRDRLTATLERFLGEWDAWICPVASLPAFKHREVLAQGIPFKIDRSRVAYELAISAYSIPFNLTGSPAVAMPVARSAEGLPIGIQLVGRLWGDMELLDTGEQVAELTGGFQRPPGY